MIYLLRHCEKTDEAAAAPLSATGFEQAEALVPVLHKLGIERLISSPFLRARQSLLPFAQAANLTLETDDALREWQLADQPRPDWQTRLSNGLANPETHAPGGESAAAVWARAQTLLTQSVPTILVSHGGWMTVVLGHFGRPATLANLLALQSPDLFSLSPEGCQHHEL